MAEAEDGPGPNPCSEKVAVIEEETLQRLPRPKHRAVAANTTAVAPTLDAAESSHRLWRRRSSRRFTVPYVSDGSRTSSRLRRQCKVGPNAGRQRRSFFVHGIEVEESFLQRWGWQMFSMCMLCPTRRDGPTARA